MHTGYRQNLRAGRFTRHIAILFAMLSCGVAGTVLAETVTLDVGSDFASIADAHPAGTKYIVKSGVHHFQHMRVKSRDTIVGEDGAVMSGAKVLSDWVKEGNYWVKDGQTQEVGFTWGFAGICASPHVYNLSGDYLDNADSTLCLLGEDLFMDNVPLLRRSSLSDISDSLGGWYFDYAADKVFMLDDPTGHTMEMSVISDLAIDLSWDTAVVVENLTVEKYASSYLLGAIGVQLGSPEYYCHFEKCVIRLNHGLGLQAGHHPTIRDCRIVWNGNMGIWASRNLLCERNEIAYNNYNHYNEGQAAGGIKFAAVWDYPGHSIDNHVLRGNYVHHNFAGSSLHGDGAATALYEGNIVEYNRTFGLMYEVSSGPCEIRCNISRFNSYHHMYPWHNLYISGSANTNAHHNIVVAGQVEGGGACGIIAAWHYMNLKNLNVHHNDITYFPGGWFYRSGITFEDSLGGDGVWYPRYYEGIEDAANMQWDYNAYHLPTLEDEWFLYTGGLWNGDVSDKTWSEWRSYGFDAHGTLDTDVRADRQLDAVECSDCQQYIDYWRNNGTSAVPKPAAVPSTVIDAQKRIEYDAASRMVRIHAVDLRSGKLEIGVYNAAGRRIDMPANVISQNSQVKLNMSALRRGVYFIAVRDGASRYVERMVVGY